MNARELAEATREFDLPSDTDYGFKPLTPAMRAEWKRVTRGPGRPKIGKGATNVLVSIERGLLKQADQFAKQTGQTRSGLMAEALRTILKHHATNGRASTTRRKSA